MVRRSKINLRRLIAGARRLTTEQTLAVVAETMQPGVSISCIARRHGSRGAWLSDEGSLRLPPARSRRDVWSDSEIAVAQRSPHPARCWSW
jgi:transposase-like protein